MRGEIGHRDGAGNLEGTRHRDALGRAADGFDRRDGAQRHFVGEVGVEARLDDQDDGLLAREIGLRRRREIRLSEHQIARWPTMLSP